MDKWPLLRSSHLFFGVLLGNLYQCFLAGKIYYRVMNGNTISTTNA